MEQQRLKPICLIIIDSFGADYLSGQGVDFSYFKNLADTFPFFMIKSSDVNVDSPWISYTEIGTGSCIKDDIVRQSLTQIILDAGLNQLYVAESELYSNLNYYFSNKTKIQDQKINRILISEPKSDSYLDDSNMMAGVITSKFLKEIDKKIYDFAVLGYANLMNQNINIELASSILSSKIKSIVDTVLALNGVVLITSNSSTQKDHNFIPLFLISKLWEGKSLSGHNHFKALNEQIISGSSYDIAPTILKIMGISKPVEMRGNSLI